MLYPFSAVVCGLIFPDVLVNPEIDFFFLAPIAIANVEDNVVYTMSTSGQPMTLQHYQPVGLAALSYARTF